MRTLVAAILLATLIVTGVAIVVPLIARPMIVAAVQSASPFGDQHLDIDIDCNVFGLLSGTVDRIHVRGSGLTRGGATVGAVDVTLYGVATSGHAFRDSAGTVASIGVPTIDGGSLAIDQATLSGPSTDVAAIATLDRASATKLISSALTDGGVDVSDIRIGNDVVMFKIFGSDVAVHVGLVAGAIVLIDPFGQGDVEIFAPAPTDAWTFDRIALTGDGLRIDASLDVEKLLASS